MSEMYNLSSQFQNKLREEFGGRDGGTGNAKERKEFQRIAKSYEGKIRCAVGSQYYMEKDAKATMVQWLIQGTANLMLALQ